MNSGSTRNRAQRGIALLSVIALLLIFIIFSGVVIVHMSQEVNTVRYDGVSNRALVAADAGVRHMIVAIEEQIPKGGLPTPVAYTYPETIGSPTVSYTASIAAGWNPLQPAGDRFYLIKSTGTVLEGGQLYNRTISAMIKAQSVTTFGSASMVGCGDNARVSSSRSTPSMRRSCTSASRPASERTASWSRQRRSTQ